MNIDYERIGLLSTNEFKIYNSLLKNGTSQIHHLVSDTKIKRTTLAETLKEMVKKKVVSVERKPRAYYTAASPEVFNQMFQDEKSNLSHSENYFKSIFPELSDLYQTQSFKMKHSFYKGEEEVQALMMKLLDETDEIYNYRFSVRSTEEMKKFWEKTYGPQRRQKRVKDHIFTLAAPDQKDALEYYPLDNRTEKIWIPNEFIPEGIQDIEKKIYKDKVVHLYYKEDFPVVHLAESEDLANAERSIFKLLWGILYKMSKKMKA